MASEYRQVFITVDNVRGDTIRPIIRVVFGHTAEILSTDSNPSYDKVPF